MKITYAKVKSANQREGFLASFLFGLAFLPYINVLFASEYLSVYHFFGLVYNCEWVTSKYFVWEVLSRLVFVLFCLLLLYNSTNRFKYFAPLFLILNFFILIYFLLIPIEGLSREGMVAFIIVTSVFLGIPLLRKTVTKRFINKDLFGSENYLANISFTFFISFFLMMRFLVNGQDAESIDLLLFSVHSYGFADLDMFLWVFGLKASLLLFLSYWFIIEKKWWKYALLSPILLTVYQIRSILSPEETHFDESEFISALPLLTMVVFVLVSLSRNAKNQFVYKSIYAKTKTQIEKNILSKRSLKTKRINETRALLHRLKGDASNGSKIELQKLKDELEDQLHKA